MNGMSIKFDIALLKKLDTILMSIYHQYEEAKKKQAKAAKKNPNEPEK
jgi:hypothetical protein